MLIILPIDSASRFYRQCLTFDTRSGRAAGKTSKKAAGVNLSTPLKVIGDSGQTADAS